MDHEKWKVVVGQGTVSGWEPAGSILIVKTQEIVQEITEALRTFAYEKQIPFRSLFVMVVRMTHRFKDREEEIAFRANLSKQTIEIPKFQEPAHGTVFLRETNNKIYSLLSEAFLVLNILCSIELLRYYQLKCNLNKGIEADFNFIKEFIAKTYCFNYFAEDIQATDNWKDLIDRVCGSFIFVFKFTDEMKKFYNVYAEFFAKKRTWIRNRNLELEKDLASQQIIQLDIDDADAEDEYWEKMEGEDSESLSYGTGIDYQLVEQHGLHSKPDGSTVTDKEIFAFHLDIIMAFMDRLDDWLLKGYRLQGSPQHVLRYVKTIIKNVGREILVQEYNRKLKERYGVGYKTVRRYERHYPLPATSSSEANQILSLDKISQIRAAKEQSQKHQRQGYFTQNQLISFLRGDDFIERCNDHGIPLKKQSVRILRNKIRQLREEGKITVTTTKDSILYLQEHLLEIAKLLADLQKK